MADARRGRADGASLGPLQIRYYRKMRMQRVYAVDVSWSKRRERRAPSGTPPITVRLLMGGAQVVPVEHNLNPNDPDARATFYVTPIAAGALRNEKLEVLIGDRKIQEVPLPARVVNPRKALKFLFLAILIPALLLTYCKYSPLEINESDIKHDARYPRLQEVNQEIQKKDRELAEVRAREVEEAKKEQLSKEELILQSARNENKARLERAQANLMKEKRDLEIAMQARIASLKTPGQVLEYRLENEMRDPPEMVVEYVPAVDDWLKAFRQGAGEVYQALIDLEDWQPISWYGCGIFLFLALGSWWLNRAKRASRQSKPIPIPRGAPEGYGASSRRAEPVGAEMDD